MCLDGTSEMRYNVIWNVSLLLWLPSKYYQFRSWKIKERFHLAAELNFGGCFRAESLTHFWQVFPEICSRLQSKPVADLESAQYLFPHYLSCSILHISTYLPSVSSWITGLTDLAPSKWTYSKTTFATCRLISCPSPRDFNLLLGILTFSGPNWPSWVLFAVNTAPRGKCSQTGVNPKSKPL